MSFFSSCLMRFLKLFSLFFVLGTFGVSQFIGDQNPGFSFRVLPHLFVDHLGQKIYVTAAEQPAEKSGAYSLSVFDVSQYREAQHKFFIPLLTRNGIINGVLEANPLFGAAVSHFNLLLSTTLEPKYYPILSVSGIPQVFVLNKLNSFDGEKNKITATQTLTDSYGNPGEIRAIASMKNTFVVPVMQPGRTLADNDHNLTFYTFGLQERIIPIPQSRDYLTILSLDTPKITSFDSCLPALNLNNENNTITFAPLKEILYGEKILNKCYFGCTAQGTAGVSAVSLLDTPLIRDFSILDGNHITMTSQPNTPIYIQNLASLETSTNLSYLLVHGGQNTFLDAINSVFALPLINDPFYEQGTLASINQTPVSIFAQNPPYQYLKTVLRESPSSSSDLYNLDNTSRLAEAFVGGGKLEYTDGIITEKLEITSIEGYKDTVFVSTNYMNNDTNGIGGIFFSQALFDEHGLIKRWTPWQRKNIVGNLISQRYIPTLGSSVGIFSNLRSSPSLATLSAHGPFLNIGHALWNSLPLVKNGIQQSVDLPYTHPGIGINKTAPFLKPSYMIHLGHHTVLLQQTARNNALLPMYGNKLIVCKEGNTKNIEEKKNDTSFVAFTGGELTNAGSLITATLGYSTALEDSWLIAGGNEGVFILRDSTGKGTGEFFLQDNFSGIHPSLSWQRLGSFKKVKKIIALDGYLFVLSENNLARMPLTYQQICSPKPDTLASIYLFDKATNQSSFSDFLVSEHACLLASSLGLFQNNSGSSIQTSHQISWKEISLPESNTATPIMLYPITSKGFQESWSLGSSDTVSSNIYVTTSSLSKHYTKIFRLVSYGSSQGYHENTILPLPNYFLKDTPTYFYAPGLELLSFVTDGATTLGHGVVGTNTLFRSYIGIFNPLLKHGAFNLKNEFNFFELTSKINDLVGFPIYNSGNGFWTILTPHGIHGVC